MTGEGLADVNGHRLYWCASGPADGPCVLLFHSGLGSVEDWRAQVPVLAHAGWRVIAYDRWGYGRSDDRTGFRPPGFDADLEDLAALAAELRLGRFVAVGHSDGGSIALGAAARWRKRVEAVVAVAAHAYVELKMLPGIAALAERYARDGAFRSALRRRHGPKSDALVDAWTRGWSRREAWLWDMREALAEIRCPTLVVQGVDDEHATRQHAVDIAEHVPGAELWLVPDVGHMLPQEAPDVLNPRLLAFLERHARRGA